MWRGEIGTGRRSLCSCWGRLVEGVGWAFACAGGNCGKGLGLGRGLWRELGA
jgi:hypothetical protein